MKIVSLSLSQLESNIGQVPELPMNPRQWTATDINKIAASLEETPELFGARPLLVYPHDGKYVILGGNLRFEGAKHNKMEKVPCIVFPADTPIEKLKEIVIKDNGSFGTWDYDALANEWDDLPLTDWGVPAWKEEDTEAIEEKPDLSDKIDFQYKIEVECINEAEQEALYNKLTEEGYKCRILTL